MSDTPQEQPRKEISIFILNAILDGQDIEGYIEHYSRSASQKVTLKNLKVDDQLDLTNRNSISLYFENTYIKHLYARKTHIGPLIISNSHIQSLQLDSCKVGGNIIFRNSQTNPIILFNTEAANIEILERSNIGWIDFRKITFESIIIKKSIINGRLNISQESFIKVVGIEDSKMKLVDFHNVNTWTINISRSSLENFNLRGGTTSNHVQVEDKTKIKSLVFSESSIIKYIIKNLVYVGVVEITHINKKSKSLNISGCYFKKFRIEIDEPYRILINEHMRISTALGLNLLLPPYSSIIYELIFDSVTFPSNAYLHISSTYVAGMYINSFQNYGNIVFSGVKSYEPGYSNIIFDNSDLGNTQFIGCDLAGFDKFTFKNSKMANVFLADTTLPHRSKITTSEDANENEQRRLALSQFKKIYEGQGDTVRAAEFRAEEMEVYRSQLNKKEKFGTWLILSFSYYTSNYGQSIWLPLASLLAIHYWLFMWALGVHAFEYTAVKELPYHFFYLANPIRAYEFRNDWTIIIDILMRIWSSYMVYNFIRASRRFIK